jgi:hypothetical protein
MPFYPNGTGSQLGDTLALAEPLVTSDDVVYVHHTASAPDAVGTPERPYATLPDAVAAALESDHHTIVVMMDGHTETMAPITISAEMTIIGAGSSSGLPTVKISFTNGASPGLAITGDNVEFRNIWFPVRSVESLRDRIYMNGVSGTQIRGCYFEYNENDHGSPVHGFNTTATTMESCTFISTAASPPDGANEAVRFAGGTAGLVMSSCVFDGGPYGFAQGVAAIIGATGDVTGLRGLNISLLRGADIFVANAALGYFNVAVSTGSARVRWAV